jgi:hypothetical protein
MNEWVLGGSRGTLSGPGRGAIFAAARVVMRKMRIT